MKIAHIFNELKFSGAEILLESAAPYFLRDSEMTIISTGVSPGDFTGRLTKAGYVVEHIPFGSLNFYWRLRSFLLNGNFDAVHIHTERAALAYSILARSIGLFSIRTIHNEFLFSGILRFRRILTRGIAQRFLGTIHVACSPSVQRNERKRFGVESVIINNWLDVSRIKAVSAADREKYREIMGIGGEEIVTISISNESPAKNLETLFLSIIKLYNSGVNIRHYHCGNIGKSLESLARSSDGVIFPVGTISDLNPYLAVSDALISAAYNEGGPISLLEAAAAGVPIITTKVGLAELFEGQDAVKFFDPVVNSLVEAISGFSNENLSNRRNGQGRLVDFTRRYFDPRRGAEEYISLYKSNAKFDLEKK